MAVWIQLQNVVSRRKKMNGSLGATVKISYFAIKKRMASWVHALDMFRVLSKLTRNVFKEAVFCKNTCS